jgi:hypothetical protein
MALARVTPERMAAVSDFRLQLNVDKALVAYGYNALVGYTNERKAAAVLRRTLTGAVEQRLLEALQLLVAADDGFAAYLAEYRMRYVDAELQGQAQAFHRQLLGEQS